MALLSRRSLALGLASGLTLTGCVIVGALTGREPRFAFSHRVHVEEGLDCDSCHLHWEDSDQPGLPSAKQCALCHDDLDAEKPPERKVAALFGEQGFLAARAIALSDEIVFSHQKHATRGEECSACHAGIEANDAVSADLALDMDACTACHVEKGGASECATCHAVIREDALPPSHHLDWRRDHGRVVRACTGATADRCDLCHQESSCETCHLAEPPQSHNGHWRRRGHGLVASMDRESCATCHKPDACDRCHEETRPLDHAGSWGAPLDRHCFGCHEPLKNETCAVCHAGTPSHALATPKPADHSPGMNCRLCHGNGQALPHVDNGDNCNACHL